MDAPRGYQVAKRCLPPGLFYRWLDRAEQRQAPPTDYCTGGPLDTPAPWESIIPPGRTETHTYGRRVRVSPPVAHPPPPPPRPSNPGKPVRR